MRRRRARLHRHGARRRPLRHLRELPGFATEFYVRQGQIAPDADGNLVAEIDIGVIEYLGNMAEGRLKRGDNPVLMTVEIALDVVAQKGD